MRMTNLDPSLEGQPATVLSHHVAFRRLSRSVVLLPRPQSVSLGSVTMIHGVTGAQTRRPGTKGMVAASHGADGQMPTLSRFAATSASHTGPSEVIDASYRNPPEVMAWSA